MWKSVNLESLEGVLDTALELEAVTAAQEAMCRHLVEHLLPGLQTAQRLRHSLSGCSDIVRAPSQRDPQSLNVGGIALSPRAKKMQLKTPERFFWFSELLQFFILILFLSQIVILILVIIQLCLLVNDSSVLA
jgi:hypothetical protein